MKARLWLGASAPGGLALPAANPTPAQFYGPRGVFLNDKVLIVADSGNHRVLIWSEPPTENHQTGRCCFGTERFLYGRPESESNEHSRWFFSANKCGAV